MVTIENLWDCGLVQEAWASGYPRRLMDQHSTPSLSATSASHCTSTLRMRLNGARQHTLAVPARRKWKKENQEFVFVLGYTERLRGGPQRWLSG